jgi:oxygen-independent coproporphyrinogen-3 oxidase
MPATSTRAEDYENSATHLARKYSRQVPRYTSYPTAPHFNTAITPEIHADWLSRLDADKPVSLYIHVPFCAQLCWYCGCHTAVARTQAPIDNYVSHLARELQTVRGAIGRRLQVKSLHFGGGTPNALTTGNLRFLFSALQDSFDLHQSVEIAAEIDPRVLTAEWMTTAVGLGLNRVSFGVQDVDPKVQRAINRFQPLEQSAWAARYARQLGISSINIDLMYGLPFQTDASIAQTISEVLSIAPDRIALFGYAHVPWMKPAQRLLPEDALPDELTRFRHQSLAARLLVDAGYVRIGFDHFAKPDDDLARQQLTRNFQGFTTDDAQTLVGIGASSISRLPQGYVQNLSKVPEWRQAIHDGKLPTARGIALSVEDLFRGELINRLMCDLHVDIAEIAGRFGIASELREVEPDLLRLAEMEAEGLVTCNGFNVAVTETGRPFLRSICSTFDRYLNPSANRHSSGV